MSGISQLLNAASKIARAKRINIIRYKRELGIMRPIQKLNDNIAVNIPTLNTYKNSPIIYANQRNLSNAVTPDTGIFTNMSTVEVVRAEVPATRAQQLREDHIFLEGIDKFKKDNIKNKGRALNLSLIHI